MSEEVAEGITSVERRGRAPLNTITAERLRELLTYDSESGEFTWRASRRNNMRQGDRAGCLNVYGYWCIRIDGRLYTAHRLAWLFVHDEWRTGDLDHADGNRANNAISNLRPATRSQNNANSRRRGNNTSGYKGVSFHQRLKKWFARLRKDGKRHHLGCFVTPEAAHPAYCQAAQKLHGEFWNPGQ